MIAKHKVKNLLKKNKYVYQVAKGVQERVREGGQASVLMGANKTSSFSSLQRGELKKISGSSFKKEKKMRILHVLMKFKNFHSAGSIASTLNVVELIPEEKNAVIEAYLSSSQGVMGDFLLEKMVRDFKVCDYDSKAFSGLLSNIRLSGVPSSKKKEMLERLQGSLAKEDVKKKEQILWQMFLLDYDERCELDPVEYFGEEVLKNKGVGEKRRVIPYLYQSGHQELGASFLEEVTKCYGSFSKEAFFLNFTYRPLWLNQQSVKLSDLDEEFLVSASALKVSFSAKGKLDAAEAIFKESLKRVQKRFHKANNFVRDGIVYMLMDVDEFDVALELILSQALPNTMLSHLNVLGYRCLEREEFSSAKDCFESVIRENPADSIAGMGLRLALPRTGESMSSILNYRRRYGYGAKNHGRTGVKRNGSDVTISLLMTGDYVNGLYSKRHAAHWKSLKRHFGKKFLNYEKLPAEDTGHKSLFVIGDEGVGDEIRTAQFYQYLSNTFKRVSITCDPRLKGVFEKSFPDIDFIPVERYRKGVKEKNEQAEKRLHGFDKKIVDYLTNDCLPVMKNSDAITFGQNLFFNKFAGEISVDSSNDGYLKPAAPSMLKKHSEKMRVGILWRSHFKTTWRKFMYLGIEDFSPLTRLEGVELWSIQHAIDDQELDYCRKNNINVLEGVDLFNDFEGLSSYLASFDLLIGISSAPIELGAALGIPVWMLGFSPENYYLRTANGATETDQLTCNSSIIAPPWIDFTASQEECCKLVFDEVCHRLNQLVNSRTKKISQELSDELL